MVKPKTNREIMARKVGCLLFFVDFNAVEKYELIFENIEVDVIYDFPISRWVHPSL